jgi:hypothetical protein
MTNEEIENPIITSIRLKAAGFNDKEVYEVYTKSKEFNQSFKALADELLGEKE